MITSVVLEKILSVTNEELNKVDISGVEEILPKLDCFNDYFRRESGSEHYRLLCFISTLLTKDDTVLDIGTNYGASALALGSNKVTQIDSYDVEKFQYVDSITLPNINFHLADILTTPDGMDKIKNASIILLDTLHDGTYEQIFLNKLIDSGFQGILLLDDIKLNHPMMDFWNSIENEKFDITTVGHVTGTGLVLFDNSEIELPKKKSTRKSKIVIN